MHRLWILVALAAGCGGEANLVTYNMGLARGFVSYADERVDAATEAMAEVDADAVCLQEIWLRQDGEYKWQTDYIDTVLAATAKQYPYSYWHRSKNEGQATSCTPEEAAGLEACALEYCGDVGAGELADCALEYCGDLFNAASTGCQSCIAANIGNPIDVIMATCVGGSGSSAYDGHNGLLLLSKKELIETNHVQFTSALTTRSALHAKVKLPGLGESDLFCTHLASDLSSILDYPGVDFGSYEEEQSYQIDALLSFVEEKATTDHTIVMGDMNTGPDELPNNYQKFTDAGYDNFYLTAFEDTLCTFCAANTLNGGEGEGGETIDHILYQSDATPLMTGRILQATQSIETSEGPIESNLSDHYGVQLILVP